MASSRRGSSSVVKRSSVKPVSNAFPGTAFRSTSVAKEVRLVKDEAELVNNKDYKRKPLASISRVVSRDTKLQSHKRGSLGLFANGSVLARDAKAESCSGGSAGLSKNLTSRKDESCKKPSMSSSQLKRQTVGRALVNAEKQRAKHTSKLAGGSDPNMAVNLLPTVSTGLLHADDDFDVELGRGMACEEALLELNLLPNFHSSDSQVTGSVFAPERIRTATIEGYCTFDGSRISPIEEASLVLNCSIADLRASVARRGTETTLKHVDQVETLQMGSAPGASMTEECGMQNATKDQYVGKSSSMQNYLVSCLPQRHNFLRHPECDSIASSILTVDFEELDFGKSSNEMSCNTFEDEANKVADQLVAFAISAGEECAPEASITYRKSSARNDENSLNCLNCESFHEETSSNLPFETSLMQLEAEFGRKATEDLSACSDQEPLFWPLSPRLYWNESINIQSSPCKVDFEENLKAGEKRIKSRQATNLSGGGKCQQQGGKQSFSGGKLSTLAVRSMPHHKSTDSFCHSFKIATSKPSAQLQCGPLKRGFGSPRKSILKSNLKPTGQARREKGLASKKKMVDFKREAKSHSENASSRNAVSKLDWSAASSSGGSTIGKGMHVISPTSSETSPDGSGRWFDGNSSECLGISDTKYEEEELSCSASSIDHFCDQIDKLQDGCLRSLSETDNHTSSYSKTSLCNVVSNMESDIIQMFDIFKLSDSMQCFENDIIAVDYKDENRGGRFVISDAKSKEKKLSGSPSSIDYFCDKGDKMQDIHFRSYPEIDNRTSLCNIICDKESGITQMFDISMLSDLLQSFENDHIAADWENATESNAGDSKDLKGSERSLFWECSSSLGYHDGANLVNNGLNLSDQFIFYSLDLQTECSIEDSIEVLLGMREFDGQEGIETAANKNLFSCEFGGMGAFYSSVDWASVPHGIEPKNAASANADGPGKRISSRTLKTDTVLGIDNVLDLSLSSETKTTISSGSSLLLPEANDLQRIECNFFCCRGCKTDLPSCKFDLQKCKMEKRAPGIEGCWIHNCRQLKGPIEMVSRWEANFHHCIDFDRWWGDRLSRVNPEQHSINSCDNDSLPGGFSLQNSGAEHNRNCVEESSVCSQHESYQEREVKGGKMPYFPINQIFGNSQFVILCVESSAIESIGEVNWLCQPSMEICRQEFDNTSERGKFFLSEWDQGNEDNISNVMCVTGLVTCLFGHCISKHEQFYCTDTFLEDSGLHRVTGTGAMHMFYNWIEPGKEEGSNILKCKPSNLLFLSLDETLGKVGFSLVSSFSDKVIGALYQPGELNWGQDSAVVFSDSMLFMQPAYTKRHSYFDVGSSDSVKCCSRGLIEGPSTHGVEFADWSPYVAEIHFVKLQSIWRKGQELIMRNFAATIKDMPEDFLTRGKKTSLAVNFPTVFLSIYKIPLCVDNFSSEQVCGICSIGWHDNQVIEYLSKDKLDRSFKMWVSNFAFLSHSSLENVQNLTTWNNDFYITQEVNMMVARQLLDGDSFKSENSEEFQSEMKLISDVKWISAVWTKSTSGTVDRQTPEVDKIGCNQTANCKGISMLMECWESPYSFQLNQQPWLSYRTSEFLSDKKNDSSEISPRNLGCQELIGSAFPSKFVVPELYQSGYANSDSCILNDMLDAFNADNGSEKYMVGYRVEAEVYDVPESLDSGQVKKAVDQNRDDEFAFINRKELSRYCNFEVDKELPRFVMGKRDIWASCCRELALKGNVVDGFSGLVNVPRDLSGRCIFHEDSLFPDLSGNSSEMLDDFSISDLIEILEKIDSELDSINIQDTCQTLLDTLDDECLACWPLDNFDGCLPHIYEANCIIFLFEEDSKGMMKYSSSNAEKHFQGLLKKDSKLPLPLGFDG